MERCKVILIGVFSALILLSCAGKDSEYVDLRGPEYAGAESCIQCHKDTHSTTLNTSHFKATAPANLSNVFGNFTAGHNTFVYDAQTKLVMEKRDDSLFQVLYKDNKEIRAYPFDIVFGTRHAQTAVYWHNNNTFEMPLSFYKSVNDWATSPGFSASNPYFGRQAIKDCYACHSSNVRNKPVTNSTPNNSFSMEVEDVMNKETIIYGIDCERCHGPAKKHVNYHLKFPNVKTAHDIVIFKNLSNQQKLDACALCHSGSDGIRIRSRFEFKPGDNLSDFYRSLPNPKDVHGNQAGLLAQSQCFIKSGSMNCVTCHSPHQNASQDLAAYSKICMDCHKGIPKHQTTTTKLIAAQSLENDCVGCHMPEQASQAISFQRSQSKIPTTYNLRTHRIAVYPIIERATVEK